MRHVLPLACALVAAPFSQAHSQSQGKPAAHPDSAAIMAVERRGWEAVKRKDTAGVFALAGGAFLYVQPSGIQRLSAATAPNAFASCDTRSYAIDSATVTPIGPSGAVLTYRLTLDQTCGGQKAPTGFYSTVVYERRNGQWVLAVRTDTPMEQSGSR